MIAKHTTRFADLSPVSPLCDDGLDWVKSTMFLSSSDRLSRRTSVPHSSWLHADGVTESLLTVPGGLEDGVVPIDAGPGDENTLRQSKVVGKAL